MERDTGYLRIMSKGIWRSICRECLQTIAIGEREKELCADEQEHSCSGEYKLPDMFDLRTG